MARSVGKVTIAFGLISIPSKLYSSGDGKNRISFNLIGPSGQRLKQQYIDPATGDVIPSSEQRKGHEYASGKYVIFTQAEIKAIQEPSSPVITITSFVPDEVPPAHVEKTYYLSPEKGAERAYELLRVAMLQEEKVALTKHCSHGKQHLAVVRASEDGLMLQHLLYSDEVTPFAEVHVKPDVRVSEPEVALAKQLIASISSDNIDLSFQRDEVKERLQAAIDAKVAGQPLPQISREEEPDPTVDLMAMLKKSLVA